MPILRVASSLCIISISCFVVASYKVVQANDDGWAVASIRAMNDVLLDAGFDVVLSAPAENKSGSGSKSTTPTDLTKQCEFRTCPVGSPAFGFNASNPRLNYVNAYPVDAARYGLKELSERFFHSRPDFLVSGPNVGSNLGIQVFFSGTIGAACEAIKQGVPAIAFSSASAQHVSYTTLTSAPFSPNSLQAKNHATLSLRFLQALLRSTDKSQEYQILPPGIGLSINYPPLSQKCSSPSDMQFILTRVYFNPFVKDVETCGTTKLPTEFHVVKQRTDREGCFASVSVFDAKTKRDADRVMQGWVKERLGEFLSCLPRNGTGSGGMLEVEEEMRFVAQQQT